MNDLMVQENICSTIKRCNCLSLRLLRTRKNRNKLTLVMVVFILLTFIVIIPVVSSVKLGLVAPGPEGADAYFYGAQFGSKVYRSSQMDKLPSYFNWGTTQTHIVTILKSKDSILTEPYGGVAVNGPLWYYDHDSSKVRVEHSRLTLQATDPIGFGKETKVVEYQTIIYENATYKQAKKQVIYLVPSDFRLDISTVPGSGLYTWENIKLWFVFDAVNWKNAYTKDPLDDPEPPTEFVVDSYQYKGAFPIIAWIGEYQDWKWIDEDGKVQTEPPSGGDKFSQLDPSTGGRVIDLYTSPEQTYKLMLSADIVQNPDLLSEAVLNQIPGLPDPAFSTTMYSYITLTSFGGYSQPTFFGTHVTHTDWYPAANYRIRVLYGVYGEYTYVWDKKTAGDVGYTEDIWDLRKTTFVKSGLQIPDILGAIAKFFSNPFAMFGFFLVLIIAVLILLVISGVGPMLWTVHRVSKKVVRLVNLPTSLVKIQRNLA